MDQFLIFVQGSFRTSIQIITYSLLKFRLEREEKTQTIQAHLHPRRCRSGVGGILAKENRYFLRFKLHQLK